MGAGSLSVQSQAKIPLHPSPTSTHTQNICLFWFQALLKSLFSPVFWAVPWLMVWVWGQPAWFLLPAPPGAAPLGSASAGLGMSLLRDDVPGLCCHPALFQPILALRIPGESQRFPPLGRHNPAVNILPCPAFLPASAWGFPFHFQISILSHHAGLTSCPPAFSMQTISICRAPAPPTAVLASSTWVLWDPWSSEGWKWGLSSVSPLLPKCPQWGGFVLPFCAQQWKHCSEWVRALCWKHFSSGSEFQCSRWKIQPVCKYFLCRWHSCGHNSAQLNQMILSYATLAITFQVCLSELLLRQRGMGWLIPAPNPINSKKRHKRRH